MSKRHICKSKFHVCHYFLDIYENPRRKNLTVPVPGVQKELKEKVR